MIQDITDLHRQLQRFAHQSDIESIKKIISNNFELLCTAGKQSSTLLHDSIESKQFDLLREIFKTFDENFQNPSLAPHCKALEATARENFFDQPDANGDTPLMLAARNDQPDLLVALLKNHAHVNHVNRHGSTPLLEAVEEESLAMVGALLEHNANSEHTDRYGFASLDLALNKENPEMYAALLHRKSGCGDMAAAHMTEPEYARDLPQVLKAADLTTAKHYLDGIAAASKDQKVHVTPYILKSLQDYPHAFKLLLQYKNGYQSSRILHEDSACSAESVPGNSDGLVVEITAQPCNAVQIVGMPAVMGLALTAEGF